MKEVVEVGGGKPFPLIFWFGVDVFFTWGNIEYRFAKPEKNGGATSKTNDENAHAKGELPYLLNKCKSLQIRGFCGTIFPPKVDISKAITCKLRQYCGYPGDFEGFWFGM